MTSIEIQHALVLILILIGQYFTLVLIFKFCNFIEWLWIGKELRREIKIREKKFRDAEMKRLKK